MFALGFALTARWLQQLDNVFLAVFAYPLLADANGGEDTFFIPRAKGVRVYLEQSARLLESDKFRHFVVVLLIFVHIASHPTFDTIIIQHRALVGKAHALWKEPVITITMASQYTDPRDFAQHIRGELLAEYLKTRHNLDFTAQGKKDETREECADRLMEYMEKQDELTRDRVFMEFEYINSLSSENHIAALCNHSPSINREEVIEKRAQNNDERALLAYINYSDEFDEYYSRANIESSAVKELTLPSTVPLTDITDAKVSAFEPKVQGVYRAAYKGEQCKIKVFRDTDNIILRAYLEDLPTRDTAFVKGKLDEKIPRKPVFDAIFIYKPELKMLGVRAIGGKDTVSQLQKLFCSHFLGIDSINTNVERYTLAPIKDLSKLNLVADASYGVERCYLKSIRLKHKGVPHKLFIDVGGKEQYSNADAVQSILKELGLDTSNGWEVESVKITIVFKQTGKGRRKQVQVAITPPNTCDLKNRPQDDVVRKLLKDWGIYVA